MLVSLVISPFLHVVAGLWLSTRLDVRNKIVTGGRWDNNITTQQHVTYSLYSLLYILSCGVHCLLLSCLGLGSVRCEVVVVVDVRCQIKLRRWKKLIDAA